YNTGKLSNLFNQDLQDNLLSGTIPASLGIINTLKNMLHGNNETRLIPSSLGNQTNLVSLKLAEFAIAKGTHSCLPRQYQDTTIS
ncbi:hypothetical protein EJB05_27769, partial [Eragrostis curvula]